MFPAETKRRTKYICMAVLVIQYNSRKGSRYPSVPLEREEGILFGGEQVMQSPPTITASSHDERNNPQSLATRLQIKGSKEVASTDREFATIYTMSQQLNYGISACENSLEQE
jgi:hypothetical protein